ncbi:hypothetical protein [Mycoplasma procyoni]|uniref:hypothetical protein n=1 Tax=Mycoplasma procyoni TaxID=568784 RepID=UPI00197B0888|nr:hypothetical protein [Mycoplasma procyoni]MBN3534708.1 hypothetical protein [Mycoplasma procyoni]
MKIEPIIYKQRNYKPNYKKVTKRKNIHVKLGDTDILYFAHNRAENRAIYITNNEKNHRLVDQWNYSEDIIFVPNLKKNLKRLDIIDKIYIHAYLLRFYALNKNQSDFDWRNSYFFIEDYNSGPDWERKWRIFQKRFKDFAPEFNADNLADWACWINE